MNKIIRIFFVSILFLGLLIGNPGTSFAQNADTNSSARNLNPGSTNTDGGFDWRWLLPLLAIPVLYFVFRDKNLNDYPKEERIAGYKGGRSERMDHRNRREYGDDDDEE